MYFEPDTCYGPHSASNPRRLHGKDGAKPGARAGRANLAGIPDKRHTRRDVYEALAIADDAGLAPRPSLMPFTPWSTRQDIVDNLDWVEEEDLVHHVDPVHYTIRLLLPPGSLLLTHPETQPYLGELDHELLAYRWRHPDAHMDDLQAHLAALVEESTARDDEAEATFALIREWVGNSFDLPRNASARLAPRRCRQRPPRLTESCFC